MVRYFLDRYVHRSGKFIRRTHRHVQQYQRLPAPFKSDNAFALLECPHKPFSFLPLLFFICNTGILPNPVTIPCYFARSLPNYVSEEPRKSLIALATSLGMARSRYIGPFSIVINLLLGIIFCTIFDRECRG